MVTVVDILTGPCATAILLVDQHKWTKLLSNTVNFWCQGILLDISLFYFSVDFLSNVEQIMSPAKAFSFRIFRILLPILLPHQFYSTNDLFFFCIFSCFLFSVFLCCVCLVALCLLFLFWCCSWSRIDGRSEITVALHSVLISSQPFAAPADWSLLGRYGVACCCTSIRIKNRIFERSGIMVVLYISIVSPPPLVPATSRSHINHRVCLTSGKWRRPVLVIK